MLTKNAYALIFGLISKTENVTMTDVYGRVYTDVNIGVNSYGLAAESYDAFFTFLPNYVNSGKPSNTGLYFGTGDTVPSANDCMLSSDAIDKLTYNKVRTYVNSEAGYSELQATLAVKNENTNSVTIKEIGLFGRLKADSGTRYFLMDRIVLATPITIGAGETKSITYNLRHTY